MREGRRRNPARPLPGDAAGYERRPDGAFPYESSPLLVRPDEVAAAEERALELVGLRWNLPIIRELRNGTTHFNALRDALGISGKMLVRRLHMLAAYGVVERTECEPGSNLFEYGLTESGRDLYRVVASLTDWGQRHLGGEDRPADVAELARAAERRPLPAVGRAEAPAA